MTQKVDACTSVRVERRPRVIKVTITFDASYETMGYNEFLIALNKSKDPVLFQIADGIEKDDPES